MHVNDVTGTDSAFPEPRIVTRGTWAGETLDAYRPLFTDMATSLGQQPDAEVPDDSGDPMMQMMAGLSRMMAPAMMGMSVGSMVGQLSQRVFGLHDLPIPRDKQEVVLVGQTIDEFATEWDIPLDQMRLWVLAHELSGFPGVLDSATCAPAWPTWSGPTSADSGPTPRRSPTSWAGSIRSAGTTRATRWRPCSRRSPTPRSCWGRSSPTPSGRCGPVSTLPWRPWSDTPIGSSTPSPFG